MHSLFHELPAPGIFLRLRLFGCPKRMVETPTAHNTIGTDAGGHRIQTGGQNRRNTHTLTLFGNRSTATRSRPSRGWQYHRLDATLYEQGSNLRTNALHGVQAAHIAHGDKHVIEQLPST